ncbi:MAG TPA: hypothetical protein VNY31_08040 [Solirubrobacteraceae bacterium]|jgi:magnesium-transporting ATPase (P-type)|nr:hypothetical protein [Solirubrobacteraceae bacterium]
MQDGLSEADAAAALAAQGSVAKPASSRSYGSIVRANVLTVFNAILAAFGAITLVFGDWRDALFLGVIVANTTIGIAQEARAKRALDRLALLVAPRATVVRDGSAREVAVGEVVPGDLVRVGAGDQVVADGEVREAHDLRLDESMLTGESEPVARGVGESIHSGVFATAVLVTVGLYLVVALEAAGSRRRSTLVSGMCLSLAGLFVAAFGLPAVRRSFALSVPTPGMIATALIASLLAIGALALASYTPVAGDAPTISEELT